MAMDQELAEAILLEYRENLLRDRCVLDQEWDRLQKAMEEIDDTVDQIDELLGFESMEEEDDVVDGELILEDDKPAMLPGG